MPTYGFLEKFSGQEEDFDSYLERLEFYFNANDLSVMIPNAVATRTEKRKSILLSFIGAETYSLLRSLYAPTKPSAKTFKEITDLLKGHFSPTP